MDEADGDDGTVVTSDVEHHIEGAFLKIG
jgi:hypothetical protein